MSLWIWASILPVALTLCGQLQVSTYLYIVYRDRQWPNGQKGMGRAAGRRRHAARARNDGQLRHSVLIGPRGVGYMGLNGDCEVVHGSVYSGRLAPQHQARLACTQTA